MSAANDIVGRVIWSLSRLGLALGVAVGACSAQQPGETPEPAEAPAPFNLVAPTRGGRQFWTDELVFRDWRIQRNSETGHCRLLDDRDHRLAWGSLDQCRGEFERLRQERRLAPLPERVVLVLHGLWGSRGVLAPVAQHLKDQGLTAMCLSYASTRGTIDDHAAAVTRVIDGWGEGVKQVDLVGHSMGNIVIRRYLATLAPDSPQRARIGRVVMIAPPNQGASLARLFDGAPLFGIVAGASGKQLARFSDLEERLAIPTCPFGIIAGGGDRSVLLSGDDDSMVTLEETKLAGARDFVVVEAPHRALVSDPQTLRYTATFLEHGWFRSEAERHPLPEPPAPKATPAP